MRSSALVARLLASATLSLFCVPLTNAQAPKISDENPVISPYVHTDEGPGKMKLLPGYVAGLPAKINCIDSDCGYIWNPRGLEISFDIGMMAGITVSAKPPEQYATYLWYGEATINHQLVRYAVSGEDRPEETAISFPSSYANFRANTRNSSEIQTLLQMVLTYQGVDYNPEADSAIDARVVQRDGTPAAGIEIKLSRGGETKNAQTDALGHFRFLQLSPGRYMVTAKNANGSPCEFAKHWTIKVEPAEIELRSFTISCRAE